MKKLSLVITLLFILGILAVPAILAKDVSTSDLVSLISANSCDADKVCEVNQLGTKNMGPLKILSEFVDLYGALRASDIEVTNRLDVGGDAQIGGDLKANWIDANFVETEIVDAQEVQLIDEIWEMTDLGHEGMTIHGDDLISMLRSHSLRFGIAVPNEPWIITTIINKDFVLSPLVKGDLGDFDNLEVNQDLNVDGSSYFDDNVEFGDYVLFNGDDNVQFEHLKGNGNAYACVNSQGMLYRSLEPCI